MEPRETAAGGAELRDPAPREAEPRDPAPSAAPAEPATPAEKPAEPATTALAEADETTLYGSLPAGFWGEEDVESEAAPGAPTLPAGTRRSTSVATAVVDAPEPAGALGAEPGSAGTAFAELQELFPGRIIEVVKDAPAAAAEGEPAEEPPEEPPDADLEGYDDPDQAPLSFGTSD